MDVEVGAAGIAAVHIRMHGHKRFFHSLGVS